MFTRLITQPTWSTKMDKSAGCQKFVKHKTLAYDPAEDVNKALFTLVQAIVQKM